MIGKEILGYHVDEKIGSGGFGTVYKVSKTNAAGTYVRALKHITLPTKKQYASVLNSMGGDYAKADDYFAGALKDIVNEIKILSTLSESGVNNIVRYYENDIIETFSPKTYDIYILMEFLTPFTDYVENRDFTVSDVIGLGKDILHALVSCHEKNIIHRDIKDDNIFVSSDGTYKLGDFGVSKALKDKSRAESVKGTPNFIAPEVYLGKEKYDNTVDVYSLGIVLYKLLNKMRNPFMPAFPAPYSTADEDAAFEARMTGRTPDLPVCAQNELGQVVLKAIVSRDQRYNSASEFLASLEDVEEKMSREELDCVVCKAIADFGTSANKNESAVSINKASDETIGAVYVAAEEETPTNEDRHLFDTFSATPDPVKPADTPYTYRPQPFVFEANTTVHTELPRSEFNYENYRAPMSEYKASTVGESNPVNKKKFDVKTLIFYSVAWFVGLVLFNIIAFVIPNNIAGDSKFDVGFWIAYLCIVLAFLGQYACTFFAIRPGTPKRNFYKMSLLTVSLSGLIAMLIAGGIIMVVPFIPWWIGVIVCAIVLTVNIIAAIKANIAVDVVSEVDEKIQTQTFIIKSLIVDSQSLVSMAKSEEFKVLAVKVYEAFRYSDPMSSPMLADVDSQVERMYSAFQDAMNAEDLELSTTIADDLVAAIGRRNQKCKLLK